ncbi:MAG: YciI family protein [Solirubrobacterales bacterium]
MKFMLLQAYGSVEADIGPMTEWKPEEVKAHIDFQKDLNAELRERGELIEGQALTAPELAKFVVSDGESAPVVTDGPFPESKELLAGYRMVDVESLDRALEIAAITSAAPGPDGEPIRQRIEVREVMGAVEH